MISTAYVQNPSNTPQKVTAIPPERLRPFRIIFQLLQFINVDLDFVDPLHAALSGQDYKK